MSYFLYVSINFECIKGVDLANIKSQEKRIRQDAKLNEANSKVRSSVRTAQKKVNKALESKEEKNIAQLELDQKKFEKAIDSAARKGIVSKNSAARKKSRMAKKINAVKASA